MKKKYDLSEFNDQIKELNKQKIQLESSLIKYLEKTGDPDPIITIGNWGTLKLCASKKKEPMKIDLIKNSIDQIITKKKLFESESKKKKFIEEIMEQIETNRTIGKKYLKKGKLDD